MRNVKVYFLPQVGNVKVKLFVIYYMSLIVNKIVEIFNYTKLIHLFVCLYIWPSYVRLRVTPLLQQEWLVDMKMACCYRSREGESKKLMLRVVPVHANTC